MRKDTFKEMRMQMYDMLQSGSNFYLIVEVAKKYIRAAEWHLYLK